MTPSQSAESSESAPMTEATETVDAVFPSANTPADAPKAAKEKIDVQPVLQKLFELYPHLFSDFSLDCLLPGLTNFYMPPRQTPLTWLSDGLGTPRNQYLPLVI